MEHTQLSSWRFVRFLTVAVLVLTNTSCTGSLLFTAAPTLNADSEGVTITFAADWAQRQLYEPLIEAFHQQRPDITVQFVGINQFDHQEDQVDDWDPYNYWRGLAQTADTLMVGGPYDIDMGAYFRDLQPLYEADPTFDSGDFWPGILNACSDSSGNVVGLPMKVYVQGIIYDQEAFDAAAIPYPAPGWTWDDFEKAVTALADINGSQIRYGFYDQASLERSILAPLVSDHLRSHDGEIDSARLLEEIRWYIDLAQAGMLAGLHTEKEPNIWGPRLNAFIDYDKPPAMWVDPLIVYLSNVDPDRFGFAPFPVSGVDSPGARGHSWVDCASISAGSPHPRASWAWLNFLSRHWLTADQTQSLELATSPARQTVAEESGYWGLLPAKALPAVKFALEHGGYDFANSSQVNEIGLALSKAIYEKADFGQELERVGVKLLFTPTPATGNAQIVIATPLVSPPEGVVEIKYYAVGGSAEERYALQNLAEQYNQRSPESPVRVITEFQSGMALDFYADLAAQFDCFTAYEPSSGFDSASLMTLDPLLNGEPDSFKGDFWPDMLEHFSTEEELYGLPASRQVEMMAYNADLLERRGLTPPANDWTFDEFIELATAAASTSETDSSYGYLLRGKDPLITLGTAVRWDDYESNPHKLFFDSPEVLAHVEWLSDLHQNNVFVTPKNDWEAMGEFMSAGQVAFWSTMMGEEVSVGGVVNYFNLAGGMEVDYKIVMVPFPQLPRNASVNSHFADRAHYISAQSQFPEVCWDWIKFMSEQPDLFPGIPARRSVTESSAWEASIGSENAEAYRAALESLGTTDDVDLASQRIFAPLDQWTSDAILEVFAGLGPQQVLMALQQRAEIYLECVQLIDPDMPDSQLYEAIRACEEQVDPGGI